MNRKYLDLYEKLFEMSKKLKKFSVSLEGETDALLGVVLAPKTSLTKSNLKDIIKVCDENGALMDIRPYGLINIFYPKESK